MKAIDNKKIIDLRQNLHRFPEKAGQYKKTLDRIKQYIKLQEPDKIYEDIIENGIAFEYSGSTKGNTIIFHTEISAQSIIEDSKLPYRSANKGISHAEGNDGHIAILAGLASFLNKNKPEKGRVILLFQPENEIFQNKQNFIDNKKFKQIKPDYVFGLQNLAGFPLNQIILKKNNFSTSTTGVVIKFSTLSGVSPKNCNLINKISEIISFLQFDLVEFIQNYSFDVNIAITKINYGHLNLRYRANDAKLILSIQASSNKEKEKIITKIEKKLEEFSIENKLQVGIDCTEDIPEISNNRVCLDIVEQAAKENNFETKFIEKPIKLTKDFGFLTLKYKGAFFGIGAGKDSPNLYSTNYNFPNKIIIPGSEMLYSISKNLTH